MNYGETEKNEEIEGYVGVLAIYYVTVLKYHFTLVKV